MSLELKSYADVDWETFWRWEIFRRRKDPVDAMRWKADSSKALRELPEGRDRGGEAPRLLDATCGLGSHALVQRRLGFRVEACDQSQQALDYADELFREEDVEIPTFRSAWEALGRERPGRYDLIFNDEVHQVFPEAALLEVVSSFHDALRPGGSFVFFYADAAKPDNGPGHARWDWEHRAEEGRAAWVAAEGGLEVTLTIRPERASETMTLEHHDYLIRADDGSDRRESMTMTRNYFWDWGHVVPVLEAAGFAEVRSHHFVNVKGLTFSMNLATRP